jgi:catechol 2,3-dioxygenase-like lactoylglutathione lyase family enzyme
MFDHIGFRVQDLNASRRFYDAAMAALGLSVIDNTATSFLIGRSAAQPIPFIWIGTDSPSFWTGEHQTSASPIHLAFSAGSPADVQAFYRAALANGGTDNGAPGPRGPAEMKYYAAFVLDPDGNNVEAGHRATPRE